MRQASERRPCTESRRVETWRATREDSSEVDEQNATESARVANAMRYRTGSICYNSLRPKRSKEEAHTGSVVQLGIVLHAPAHE
jgi:hypothetical protein